MKLIRISAGEYKAENERYEVAVSHLHDRYYGKGKMWFASIIDKTTGDQHNFIEPTEMLKTIKSDLNQLDLTENELSRIHKHNWK